MSKSHSSSGDGDDYSAAEEGAIEAALDRALYMGQGGTDTSGARYTVNVRAQVEWAGVIDNNRNGGVRATKLEVSGAGLRQVERELGRSATAEPGRSYRAKGWQAQLREMQRTQAGREAVRGIRSRETLRRYGLGTQTPNAQTRARITEAHAQMKSRAGERTARRNARAVAAAFTDALADKYGVKIRLREIEHLSIRRET